MKEKAAVESELLQTAQLAKDLEQKNQKNLHEIYKLKECLRISKEELSAAR